MAMDKEKLERWIDGIAGFIVWSKAHGEDLEDVLATLIYHDIPGIRSYVDNPEGPASFFSPRSSGYAKYIVVPTKKELHKKDA